MKAYVLENGKWQETELANFTQDKETGAASFDWSFSYGLPGRAESLPVIAEAERETLGLDGNYAYYHLRDKGGAKIIAVPFEPETAGADKPDGDGESGEKKNSQTTIWTTENALLACIAIIGACSLRRGISIFMSKRKQQQPDSASYGDYI